MDGWMMDGCSVPARISKGQGAGAKREKCQNKKGHLALDLHKCVSTHTYDVNPLRYNLYY